MKTEPGYRVKISTPGRVRLLVRDDTVGARELFEKCLATNVTNFSEYHLAQVELVRLTKTKN